MVNGSSSSSDSDSDRSTHSGSNGGGGGGGGGGAARRRRTRRRLRITRRSSDSNAEEIEPMPFNEMEPMPFIPDPYPIAILPAHDGTPTRPGVPVDLTSLLGRLRVEQSHHDVNVEEEQGEANDDEVGPLRFDQLSREMQDLLRCGICTDFDSR